MGEEFQGGVCGGTWWNPPRDLFSCGGDGGLSSPCSVAQLGTGGFDMNNFLWQNEAMKNNESTIVYNSMFFPADMESTLDIFGFGPSPTSSTTDWNQPNQFCSQEGSPPMAVTASNSNSSGDSSTSFPMSSSASYLIQTLFDDTDNNSHDQLINQNYAILQPPPLHELAQLNHNKLDHGSMNMMMINGGQGFNNGEYSNETALSNIQASLLNSLQSRSRASTFNKKSRTCANNNIGAKGSNEEVREVKSNVNEQTLAKRPRIETPSPLPTFKVRKEKLGDRITALQQLVSPFGKTDTASVLHEAIEYIKFLHDQLNVLSTPYLKNGAAIQHQQDAKILKDKEDLNQDLRSRGLCLVPISSTYPVAQETPVDFWTPTFGGSTF